MILNLLFAFTFAMLIAIPSFLHAHSAPYFVHSISLLVELPYFAGDAAIGDYLSFTSSIEALAQGLFEAAARVCSKFEQA